MNFKNLSIKLADIIAAFIGSWKFIIIQSAILTVWVVLNILKIWTFDPYPFILLNLFLSFEAAYATPLILMSSNRQSERDREHLLKDVELDAETNVVIKEIAEDIRLDKTALEELKIASAERAEMKQILLDIHEHLHKCKE